MNCVSIRSAKVQPSMACRHQCVMQAVRFGQQQYLSGENHVNRFSSSLGTACTVVDKWNLSNKLLTRAPFVSENTRAQSWTSQKVFGPHTKVGLRLGWLVNVSHMRTNVPQILYLTLNMLVEIMPLLSIRPQTKINKHILASPNLFIFNLSMNADWQLGAIDSYNLYNYSYVMSQNQALKTWEIMYIRRTQQNYQFWLFPCNKR